MKKHVILAAIVTSALLGCQSTSTGTASDDNNSNYSALAGAAISAAMQAWEQQNSGGSTLADAVQSTTNVSTEQAAGGVASLLALAQNSLSPAQSTELEGLVPGYDTLASSGLSSLLTSSGAVESAFSAIGLDPSMVSTFAPIILQVLQTQGASSMLLDALGSVWQ
jgi:hypothetical protein